MNGLSLETQGQMAAAVALLSLIFGAASWEMSAGALRWIGRATIAAGVLQLMAFSQYAVRQYHVLVVRSNIPLVEVAHADSGRERTIERVHHSSGRVIERESIAGWRLVTADGAGRGRATDWRLLRGDDSVDAGDRCSRGGGYCSEKCLERLLGVSRRGSNGGSIQRRGVSGFNGAGVADF